MSICNGLERIEVRAFYKCTSLERIIIPPTVQTIHYLALESCTNLTNEKFCDKNRKFVAGEAMSHWWSRGVHEKSLITNCFMVRCSIPARFLGLARIRTWQVNIHHTMLRSTPTISTEGMNAYFDTIESSLTFYENLLNGVHMLFPEQFGMGNDIVLVFYPSCNLW